MQHYGLRSLLVLAKVGYELREEFSDTFNEPVEDVFRPFLEALEDGSEVLSLGSADYQWHGDDHSFRFAAEPKQVAR